MVPPRNNRGFTLIEILVVVVIVATIVGTVVLSMGLIGDDRELDTERNRIASLIEVAQDEAMMQGREFGIEFMLTSYRFVEYDPFGFQWSEVPGDELFRLRELPEEMELDLYLEGQRITLEIDPRQFADPEDDESSTTFEDYEPHIFVFSSGEATPFELRLRRGVNDQELVMRGDIFGDIEFGEEEL
ncbi:MAG: type II secretion system minor pseudopilin GspH [Woeseiaceae bacterium]